MVSTVVGNTVRWHYEKFRMPRILSQKTFRNGKIHAGITPTPGVSSFPNYVRCTINNSNKLCTQNSQWKAMTNLMPPRPKRNIASSNTPVNRRQFCICSLPVPQCHSRTHLPQAERSIFRGHDKYKLMSTYRNTMFQNIPGSQVGKITSGIYMVDLSSAPNRADKDTT